MSIFFKSMIMLLIQKYFLLEMSAPKITKPNIMLNKLLTYKVLCLKNLVCYYHVTFLRK